MAAVDFLMVNDQSGEEVRATLANEADYRAKGFRIVEVGRYDAAMGQRADDLRQPAPPADPVAEALARQGYEDAKRAAEAAAGTGTPERPAPPQNDEELRARYEKATVDQLKQFASSNGIDLAGATRKDEIVDALMTATSIDNPKQPGDDNSGSGGGAGGAE